MMCVPPDPPWRVYLCGGATCAPHTLPTLQAALEDALWDADVLGGVTVQVSSCQGHCARAPNMLIYPGGVRYHNLTVATIQRIVQQHLLQGVPVADANTSIGAD